MHAESTQSLFATEAHNPAFFSVRQVAAPERELIDFCVPVNRHFPPPSLLEDIRSSLPDIVKYYPEYAEVHQEALSALTGVPAARIVVANGSTELITMLCQQAAGPMASCTPTFGQWTDLPESHGVPIHYIQRKAERDHVLSVGDIVGFVRDKGIQTLVLSNPNNPTGAAMPGKVVRELLQQLSDLPLIIIDESFIDYSRVASAENLVAEARNLVVVKSLGKSLGWHGLRLGYAVTHEERAALIRKRLPFWNINGLAAFVLQRVAGMRAELRDSFSRTDQERQAFVASLQTIDRLRVFPSEANFVFVELDAGISGKALRNSLLEEHGCFIRECSNKRGSSERYLRLAVNLPAENELLVSALQSLLGDQAG
ncbi:pyridoxal phosphate-dependent aminotransferase [Granulosicoccus sp. 3-233]|uniref:pyridoxal phosphate-dependent aminotransferase n=1 Tax=Granulosicoccus sp. 3-233 TaxID=3417969 RepID=UPI003D32886A